MAALDSTPHQARASLWVVVVLASSVLAALLLTDTWTVISALVVAGSAAVLLWFARQDWWGRAYAACLTLLIAASSSVPAVAEASFYARYVVMAVLVALSFASGPSVALRGQPIAARRLVRTLWALVTLSALSTIWSYSPGTIAQQSVALALLAATIHGLVTHRWVKRERITSDLIVAYDVLVAAAAASLAASLVGAPGSHAYGGRLQGVFSNPNTMGMALALAIPLGWGIYWSRRRARYLMAMALPLYAVLLSGSRTAFLAAALGVAVIGLRYLFTRKYGVQAVAALLSAIGVTYAFGAWRLAQDVLSRFGSLEGGSVLNSREVAWQLSFELWRMQPYGGWGYASGEEVFAAHHGSAWFGFTRTSAHGSAPQMLLELGSLGTALYAALVVILVVAVARSPLTGIFAGLLGLVVAGLAIQITESAAFGTGQVYPLVFWTAGAALCLAPEAKRRSRGGVAFPRARVAP